VTDISQLTSVSADVGKYDDQALGLARDYLTDCTSDYLLFRYSGTVYFLFTGSDFTYDANDGVFSTGENFHVTELQAVLIPSSTPTPFTDTYSGEVIGLEGGVAIEEINGTITRQREPAPLQYYYITASYDVETQLDIDASPNLSGMQPVVYSNIGSFPRLVEGVSNHVATTNFILLGFVGYLLFHSVFRHVSN